MELLKNLPSYNKENFSRFIQGACKVERKRERDKVEGGKRLNLNCDFSLGTSEALCEVKNRWTRRETTE